MKIKIKKRAALISSAIVLLTVALDFLTKRLVMNSMTVGQSIPLIKNVLHLTYITNKGAAFGSFSDARWLYMSVSALMILLLAGLLLLWDENSPMFYVSVSMIIGGGIGNMIDRIFYGAVVDFIDFCAFDFWVWIFNAADSFVCVGVGLLIIYYIRAEIGARKKQRNGDTEN